MHILTYEHQKNKIPLSKVPTLNIQFITLLKNSDDIVPWCLLSVNGRISRPPTFAFESYSGPGTKETLWPTSEGTEEDGTVPPVVYNRKEPNVNVVKLESEAVVYRKRVQTETGTRESSWGQCNLISGCDEFILGRINVDVCCLQVKCPWTIILQLYSKTLCVNLGVVYVYN